MFVTLACMLTACSGGGDEEAPTLEDDVGLLPVGAGIVDPSEVTPGGGNTVALGNNKAFSKSNPQLGFRDEGKFKSGDFEFPGHARRSGSFV